jgi:uncharacterized cupin superfamily protein
MPTPAPPRILSFRGLSTAGEPGSPDPSRIVRGHPSSLAHNHYTDATGQFFSGEWTAEDGAWRVAYSDHEEEFCLLLEGRVTLTGLDGHRVELTAGDAFVVPGGFEGTWENHGRVRKLYAIMALKESTP